jgi:uncharacterized small protein (DUF1192 family)
MGDTHVIEALSEADLAARLHELGERRAAVQAETDRLDAEIDRLETELAGRGAGG